MGAFEGGRKNGPDVPGGGVARNSARIGLPEFGFRRILPKPARVDATEPKFGIECCRRHRFPGPLSRPPSLTPSVELPQSCPSRHAQALSFGPVQWAQFRPSPKCDRVASSGSAIHAPRALLTRTRSPAWPHSRRTPMALWPTRSPAMWRASAGTTSRRRPRLRPGRSGGGRLHEL